MGVARPIGLSGKRCAPGAGPSPRRRAPWAPGCLALHLRPPAQHGRSSLELARQLGGNRNSAGKLLPKLRQALRERHKRTRWEGVVQRDDAS